MFEIARTGKRAALAAAFAAAIALSGCGSGVQLEGPGFEALGLTSNKNKGEAKVPDRAPLLVPPDRARLPEPQQETAAAAPRENWPNDPDALAKSEASEAAAAQKEYEDNGNWDPKADIDEWNKLMDPTLRQPGILSSNKPLGDEYRDTTQYPDQ